MAFLGLELGLYHPVHAIHEVLDRLTQLADEDLCEFNKDYVSLQWQLLGDAIVSADNNENSLLRHRKAIEAYRAALQDVSLRTRQPLFWATVKNNLGLALLAVGRVNPDDSLLDEARLAFQESIASFSESESTSADAPRRGLDLVVDELLRRAVPLDRQVVIPNITKTISSPKVASAPAELPSAPIDLTRAWRHDDDPLIVASPFRIGILKCVVEPGVGVIFGSEKHVVCIYTDRSGQVTRYSGMLRNAGIDIGATIAAKIVWAVYALKSPAPDSIADRYSGGGENISVLFGTGSNIFIAGNVALQPLDQAQLGINFAIGHSTLDLREEP
jgi:hypothetical protein